MNPQRKDLVKMVVTDSPCDKCPYFWEEKDRSCRDECEDYKTYVLQLWLKGKIGSQEMQQATLYGAEVSPK